MSVLQRLWGNIPVSPETRGRRLPAAVGKRWLHVVARYAPLAPAWRAELHRRRGVGVGRRVFIGTEVFIDDAVPSSVTLEDDVTVIAQTTILEQNKALNRTICLRDQLPQPAAIDLTEYLPFLRMQ